MINSIVVERNGGRKIVIAEKKDRERILCVDAIVLVVA